MFPPDVATRRRLTLQTARTLGWASDVSPRAVVGICAAAAAVVVETAHMTLGAPAAIRIGDVPVSPSIIPALVAAIAGGGLLGRARFDAARRVFWAVAAIALVASGVAYVQSGDAASIFGLLVAALDEELVYRLAGPALVAYGLTGVGMTHRRARIVGYVVSGAAFVVLPGHTEQWSTVTEALPFVAYTVIATLAVHRSGAVLEIGLVHGIVNIINFGRLNGDIGSGGGALLVATLIVLLVFTYVPPHPQRRVPEPDVLIDLTGPTPQVIVDPPAR